MNPTCDVCKCLTHAPILRGNQLVCANCLNIPVVAKPVFVPETVFETVGSFIPTVGSLVPPIATKTIHDDETPSTIPLATFEKSNEEKLSSSKLSLDETPAETPSSKEKEVDPLPEPPKGKKSFFSKKGR